MSVSVVLRRGGPSCCCSTPGRGKTRRLWPWPASPCLSPSGSKRGLGLLVTGFVPSPLGKVVRYTPTGSGGGHRHRDLGHGAPDHHGSVQDLHLGQARGGTRLSPGELRTPQAARVQCLAKRFRGNRHTVHFARSTRGDLRRGCRRSVSHRSRRNPPRCGKPLKRGCS